MSAILAEVRRRLRAAGDPARAAGMQAYMKSAMPFHGVATPVRRRLVRAAWLEHRPADAAAWRRQAGELWDGAVRREERYAALDWLRLGAKAFLDLEALPLIERMIVAGAWWDIVDELAGQHLGALLARHPRPLDATLRAWAFSDCLWKRRAAIIAQLNRKRATDVRLLAACILPALHPSPFAREFFIAKGIGWALRQHARHDPVWVRAFLREHHDRLPALSRREAAKHLAAGKAMALR